jgi:hypothetical protein
LLAWSACCLLHAGFLLVLFFSPEDGCNIFIRNVGLLSAYYTTLYPRRYYSSSFISLHSPLLFSPFFYPVFSSLLFVSIHLCLPLGIVVIIIISGGGGGGGGWCFRMGG